MKKSYIFGAIIAIILVVGGIYLLTKDSDKKTPAPAASSSVPTTTTPASTEILVTKTDSLVGQYLANGGGLPLYTYDKDAAGVSNCSGSCLDNWPIYKAIGTTGLPTDVTVISRADSTQQYAYKGMPLYTFDSDSVGNITGDGVSDFHVAKP